MTEQEGLLSNKVPEITSIAAASAAASAAVASNAVRQTALEGQFNSLVINAGSSNAEIVAGRTSVVTGQTFDTMGHRADGVDAQLAETAKLGLIAETFPYQIPEVDDTGYIQRAINSLIGIGGKVFITKTSVMLNTPIVLDTRHQGISILGTGWGRGTTVASPITLRALTSAIISATSGAYLTNLANPIRGLEISDLLVMSQTADHDHLIMLNGVYSGQFNHLYTSGITTGKDNFQLSNFADVTINNYVVGGSGKNGLNVGDGVVSNSSTSLRMLGGYIGHCRNAGIWGVGAEQMSHVKILGTILESNGRDVAGAPIDGELGIGVIFDNADDLELNVYAEANVTADIVIGGTTTTAGVATVGLGCRSVIINGYMQGLGTGVNCREGLKVIKADGIEVNGYYSAYTHANIAINDPTKVNVVNLRFNNTSMGEAPSASVADDANRMPVNVNPNGYVINGKATYAPNAGGLIGSEIAGDYIKCPSLTTAQAANIVSPSAGMIYYNTIFGRLMVYIPNSFYPLESQAVSNVTTAITIIPNNVGIVIIQVATPFSATVPVGLYNGQTVKVCNIGAGTVTITGAYVAVAIPQGYTKELTWSSATGAWLVSS